MKRVLVVGVGAIGGTLAASLSEHDPELVGDVVGLTTNAGIAAAVAERGYRLVDGGRSRTVRGRIATSLPADARFDYVLLAAQPPQVEDAARSVVDRLAPGGAMVCFQNGLCEERIARIVGPDRVLGAVVGWGASMPEPGVYERTSEGGFTIGRLDGREDPRVDELAVLLEIVGPVARTSNLVGARWSKLAINCGISTLGTIVGDRLGAVLPHRWARRLGLEIVTEVVAVAKAEDIRLEKLVGTIDLDWLALTPAERAAAGSIGLFAKHSLLYGVLSRYRNLRSSMLQAIERGRPPAVDFLNGEIVDRGARHGVPTPVNAAAADLVRAIARKERPFGLDTLRSLYDTTR